MPREAPEFIGTMPRWPEDDPPYIAEFIRQSYGRALVAVADVTKALGFDARKDGDPTLEYQRVRRAMHKALTMGLLRRSGKKWGLP